MAFTIKKYYRSLDGQHDFEFRFVPAGGHIDIYCAGRPSLNGHDSSVHKTHVWPDNKICFVAGREPRDHTEAERRAKEWAEYYLEYRRTGAAQS
jgi:hypothetical protein